MTNHKKTGWGKPWVMFLLPLVLILLSRLPSIGYDAELNADESQLMAQALRYQQDMTPWRSVDGTTSGPLNSWIFVWLHQAGMPLNYAWAHLAAALVLALSCGLVTLGLMQLPGLWPAFVGGLSASVSIALAQGRDYGHFSSEVLPLLLLSGGFVLVTHTFRESSSTGMWRVGAAFVFGMTPWAKLQTLPIGLLLTAWICLDAWDHAQAGRRWMQVFMTMAAYGAFSVFMLAWLGQAGCLDDFWYSYLGRNMAFLDAGESIRFLWLRVFRLFFSFGGSQAGPLVLGATFFTAAWWWRRCPGWKVADKKQKRMLMFLSVWVLTSLLVVVMPVTGHMHYELLVFLPTALFAACLGSIWNDLAARLVLAAAVILVPLSHVGESVRIADDRHTIEQWTKHTASKRIGGVLRLIAPKGARMAVWGWVPSLHVLTGMMPGTRHVISDFVINPHPLRDRFRQSYLADIQENPPELFVDAVTPALYNWQWDASHRVQSFPELAEFLNQRYVLFDEIVLNGESEPVRVYLRRD